MITQQFYNMDKTKFRSVLKFSILINLATQKNRTRKAWYLEM